MDDHFTITVYLTIAAIAVIVLSVLLCRQLL
jgi:hypothetical protein